MSTMKPTRHQNWLTCSIEGGTGEVVTLQIAHISAVRTVEGHPLLCRVYIVGAVVNQHGRPSPFLVSAPAGEVMGLIWGEP